MSKYRVNEIFYSIQGEGFYTGSPAVFVRFSGCNRKCSFCDTKHESFTEMTAAEIADAVQREGKSSENLIVLTGGEPLLQIDEDLLHELLRVGTKISVETNGSLLSTPGMRRLLQGIWITCSPKTDTDIENLARLKGVVAHEIKVVYTGQDMKKYESICAWHYYLQPCSCQNTEEVIQKVMENPKWRLSLQTQKILNLR